jgi:hypothetical protein
MSTYNILQPEYSFSHTYKPEPPAREFDVFHLSWRLALSIEANTVETALAKAKALGFYAPVIEPVRKPAYSPTLKETLQ